MKYITLILLITSCSMSPQGSGRRDRSNERSHLPATSGLSTIPIYSDSNGHGYEIYAEGLLLISQPMIPGVGGNQKFASAADADHVAQLVVNKIRNNEFPPAVTYAELDSLGISHLKLDDVKSGQ